MQEKLRLDNLFTLKINSRGDRLLKFISNIGMKSAESYFSDIVEGER